MSTTGPLSWDDRIAIERLMYDYCELVDLAHIDELADLFTVDAVIDYGHGRLIHGRDRIRDLFQDRLPRYHATSHHVSNVMIDGPGESTERFTGRTARVASTIYAWHRLLDDTHAEVWGRYHDVVTDDDGRWRLASRQIRAAGWRGFETTPGSPGPFQTIERRRP